MRRLVTKKFFTLFLSVVIIVGALIFSASAEDAPDEYERIGELLLSERMLEGEGSNADWLAILLAQSGEGDRLSDYAARLTARLDTEIEKNDKIRTALVCLALGIGEDFVANAANDSSLDRLSDIIWRIVIAVNLGDSELAAELSEDLEDCELESGGYALSGEVADPDLTAMAVCALKMAGREVGELVGLLSSMQCESGAYYSLGAENAESTAQVVIALSVCGIDPDTDPRFIKNGVSVLGAMRSFATLDGGYAHTEGDKMNGRASVQVALALLSLKKGDSLYLFDGEAVTPSAPAPEKSEGIEIGYKPIASAAIVAVSMLILGVLALLRRFTAKNIMIVAVVAIAALAFIIFTNIQTPEQYYSENPDPITEESEVVRLSIVGEELLIDSKEYALREGESALDLLIRAARYEQISLDADGGYVRGIGGLYEFDRGEGSGWVFYINGEYMKFGADSVTLHDGDVVKWVYTQEIGR